MNHSSRNQKSPANDSDKLCSVLENVLRLAVGQDQKLDRLLTDLSSQIKADSLSSVTLAQLDGAVSRHADLRRERNDKFLRGFGAAVAQLLALVRTDASSKELAAFIRHARKHINTPGESELLPLRFAKVQGFVLEGLSPNAQQEPIADVDTGEVINIEAMFESDALEELPPYATVAQAIEDILSKLLAEINVPVAAQPYWENASTLLAKGLNWYELAALLEQLALIIQYAGSSDSLELERFLQDITARLQSVQGGVQAVDGVTRAMQDCSGQFEAELRKDIGCLSTDIQDAVSIDAIKASVNKSVDVLEGQIDQFHRQQEQLSANYENEIKDLNQRIAELESASVEAQDELEEMKQVTETDALTGLPNREAYDRMMSLELSRWERYQQSFCLAVADIDHFKAVNDHYGHLAGDKVLAVVAKTIRKRLRRVDFVARYGGEEFVIILPAASSETASELMKAVGDIIRDSPFHYDKKPLKITVSFGVAQVAEADTAESLFARADSALYEAKARGRDRVEIADS